MFGQECEGRTFEGSAEIVGQNQPNGSVSAEPEKLGSVDALHYMHVALIGGIFRESVSGFSRTLATLLSNDLDNNPEIVCSALH